MRIVVAVLMSLSLVAGTVSSSLADEILDRIDQAKTLYQQGKFSGAVSELNFAAGQIQGKRAEQFTSLLPEPLSGWQAEPVETETAGAAMMGGGIAVSRSYSNGAGENVEIKAVTDSPLLAGMLMMFSNPMFMGTGNKLITVKGEKAIEEWSAPDKTGKIDIILDNKLLLTISGNNLSSQDVLLSYANKIDFDKIKSTLKE